MMVVTGSQSKKFGDVCYTLIIFSTNISDYIVERLITYLHGDNYSLYFFLAISFSCFIHFICVYVLIGSRIKLLLINPDFDFDNSSKKNSNDITEYVALIKNRRKFLLFKSLNKFTREKTPINIFNLEASYNNKEDYSFRITTMSVQN